MLEVSPECFRPNDDRVAALGQLEADHLRVMSYNLLWGLSAQSTKTKAARMGTGAAAATKVRSGTPGPGGAVADLSQLPVPIKSRCYREHVLLREILAYGSTISCLQEVT